MPLTDVKIRKAKPKDKVYRLSDQHGLCLEVTSSGSKLWRYRYRFNDKATMLSLGRYPEISLAEARERHLEARKQLLNGLNPKAVREQQVADQRMRGETFEAIAQEYLAKEAQGQTEKYARDILRRLENHVFPHIGSKPIRDVGMSDVMEVLKHMENKGVLDTARRQLQKIGAVFRYAVRTGKIDQDPSAILKGTLSTRQTRHYASIRDPKGIGGLLRAIDDYSGNLVTKYALQLAPLTIVRPGELRHAEWAEIDLEKQEWRIPAEKMKMKIRHMVPLSSQAVDVLNSLSQLTGGGTYLFPSLRSASRPMSENTVNAALRRMGYTKEEMVIPPEFSGSEK